MFTYLNKPWIFELLKEQLLIGDIKKNETRISKGYRAQILEIIRGNTDGTYEILISDGTCFILGILSVNCYKRFINDSNIDIGETKGCFTKIKDFYFDVAYKKFNMYIEHMDFIGGECDTINQPYDVNSYTGIKNILRSKLYDKFDYEKFLFFYDSVIKTDSGIKTNRESEINEDSDLENFISLIVKEREHRKPQKELEIVKKEIFLEDNCKMKIRKNYETENDNIPIKPSFLNNHTYLKGSEKLTEGYAVSLNEFISQSSKDDIFDISLSDIRLSLDSSYSSQISKGNITTTEHIENDAYENLGTQCVPVNTEDQISTKIYYVENELQQKDYKCLETFLNCLSSRFYNFLNIWKSCTSLNNFYNFVLHKIGNENIKTLISYEKMLYLTKLDNFVRQKRYQFFLFLLMSIFPQCEDKSSWKSNHAPLNRMLLHHTWSFVLKNMMVERVIRFNVVNIKEYIPYNHRKDVYQKDKEECYDNIDLNSVFDIEENEIFAPTLSSSLRSFENDKNSFECSVLLEELNKLDSINYSMVLDEEFRSEIFEEIVKSSFMDIEEVYTIPSLGGHNKILLYQKKIQDLIYKLTTLINSMLSRNVKKRKSIHLRKKHMMMIIAQWYDHDGADLSYASNYYSFFYISKRRIVNFENKNIDIYVKRSDMIKKSKINFVESLYNKLLKRRVVNYRIKRGTMGFGKRKERRSSKRVILGPFGRSKNLKKRISKLFNCRIVRRKSPLVYENFIFKDKICKIKNFSKANILSDRFSLFDQKDYFFRKQEFEGYVYYNYYNISNKYKSQKDSKNLPIELENLEIENNNKHLNYKTCAKRRKTKSDKILISDLIYRLQIWYLRFENSFQSYIKNLLSSWIEDYYKYTRILCFKEILSPIFIFYFPFLIQQGKFKLLRNCNFLKKRCFLCKLSCEALFLNILNLGNRLKHKRNENKEHGKRITKEANINLKNKRNNSEYVKIYTNTFNKRRKCLRYTKNSKRKFIKIKFNEIYHLFTLPLLQTPRFNGDEEADFREHHLEIESAKRKKLNKSNCIPNEESINTTDTIKVSRNEKFKNLNDLLNKTDILPSHSKERRKNSLSICDDSEDDG